jgi:hypothetical protein
MPRIRTCATLLALCLVLASCDDDGAGPGNTLSTYEDQSQEWHVLANLQRACNERSVDHYADLFDPNNFTFVFDPDDVAGGEVPATWHYPQELGAATHMFTGDGGTQSNPILSIQVTLPGIEEATWTDVQDSRFPGETLRQTTVTYTFFIDTEADIQFITQGAPKAVLTVRKVDGKWKLVQWEDLASTALRRSPGGDQGHSWGKIKALYAGKAPVYMDLSRNWHVLNNLELACNQTNVDRYAELLDPDNFTFFFNPGDVGGGVPAQWDYPREIAAATNMFTGDGGQSDNPILSIDLTLYDQETVSYVEVTDDPDFPGETLQRVTVNYGYIMETANDLYYITSGAPAAQFDIRHVDGKWKLVRWYDLDTTALSPTAPATEETTWGSVKALYQGEVK